jgi:hypothetical protein
MKKQLLLTIGIVLLVGGIAFYVGMKYNQSAKSAVSGNGAYQQRTGSFNGTQRAISGSGQGLSGQGGLSSGEIISKDGNMLTIKLRNGGTALVLLSASTVVNKYSPGELNDLVVGDQVMVSGEKGADGSLSAKSVQIQPSAPKTQG